MCWDFETDDDYDDDREPCEHEDYDVDCLEGRAYCSRCGEAWWLTSEQLKHELQLQADAAQSFAEEMAKSDPPREDAT